MLMFVSIMWALYMMFITQHYPHNCRTITELYFQARAAGAGPTRMKLEPKTTKQTDPRTVAK